MPNKKISSSYSSAIPLPNHQAKYSGWDDWLELAMFSYNTSARSHKMYAL